MDRQLLRQKFVKYSQKWKHKDWCFQKNYVFKIVHFGILIYVLSCRQQKHQCLCFHYWDYLTNFWRNNWQSIIDVVERLTCRTIAVDSFLLQKLHDFDVCQWGVVEGLQSRWGIFQACQILQATNTTQTIIWNISIILHGYWILPLNYWKRLGRGV